MLEKLKRDLNKVTMVILYTTLSKFLTPRSTSVITHLILMLGMKPSIVQATIISKSGGVTVIMKVVYDNRAMSRCFMLEALYCWTILVPDGNYFKGIFW